MKRLMHLGVFALTLLPLTTRAESAKVLFTCAIDAKTASVTNVGKSLSTIMAPPKRTR